MRENLKFVIRVTFIHCMTYVLCGIIFSALFHYDELYQQGTIKYFMRPVDSFSTLLGPAFQTVRGLLFGFILLLFKDNILLQKHSWLKLWAITAGLGIVNTPGPAPCSIEGIIYTQLPLEFHIKGAPELLIQTLLFSYLVANPERFQLLQSRLRKHRTPLVSAVSAWVLFSLSGVILALILHLNIKEGMTDFGAYIVMLIAVLSVFFVSKWYQSAASRLKHIVFLLCCYMVLAVIPTLYNQLAGSLFASSLTLGINAISAVILFFINYTASLRNNSNRQNISGILEE